MLNECINMEGLFGILFILGVIYLVVWAIKAIIRSATNVPTWEGIIISAILGMLPFYLFLCFFGLMGEARKAGYMNNKRQSETRTYTEEMSRKYAYEKTSKKKRNWINYMVLVFVVVSFFYILKSYNSDEQETITTNRTSLPVNLASEDPKEDSLIIVKKKSVNQEQTTQKKTSNPEMEKPLIELKRNIAIEPTQSELKISEKENKDTKTNENTNSTLELLEKLNHANVVMQAKEAGVSTEGSTLEILERINHASVVKQAKEAGVSTEGSTLEILERINRKALEDYLK